MTAHDDRARDEQPALELPAVLVARCKNHREDLDEPCTGRIRFRWGQSQAACDTCGGYCGIAVAAWERVEGGVQPAPAGDEELREAMELIRARAWRGAPADLDRAYDVVWRAIAQQGRELARLRAIERQAREVARPPSRRTSYTTGYQHAGRYILGEGGGQDR